MQHLVDLIDNFRVYALCVPCERMVGLDLDELLTRLGGELSVAELRARVRCQACGRRTQDIRVVYVGPKDSPAVFHYRR